MNERIKELIIETLGKDGVIDSRAFGHWALSDEQMEKFAELIVRECISALDIEVYIATREDGEQALHDVILLEHFGVQE